MLFFSLTAHIREQKYRTTERGFESVQCGRASWTAGSGSRHPPDAVASLYCSYIFPTFLVLTPCWVIQYTVQYSA